MNIDKRAPQAIEDDLRGLLFVVVTTVKALLYTASLMTQYYFRATVRMKKMRS